MPAWDVVGIQHASGNRVEPPGGCRGHHGKQRWTRRPPSCEVVIPLLGSRVPCGAPPGDGDAVADVWNDCPVLARVSVSVGMAGAVGRRTAAAASPGWRPVAFRWPGRFPVARSPMPITRQCRDVIGSHRRARWSCRRPGCGSSRAASS